MDNFSYQVPTKIVFGRDTEQEVARQIKGYGGSKVLVVYGGGSVVTSGLLDRVRGLLAEEKLANIELGGVKPNPTVDFARKGVRLACENKVDFILAVGGGSVIDTAKGIAHGTANPTVDIWDFWLGKAVLQKSLPVGVILTISAAGSEMSDSAVLTNEDTGEKKGLGTELNRPCFAILNPELTFTLPEKQIACGIVDIMMHTMDRYFTHVEGNALTDGIAETLLRTVIASGRAAMGNHQDYEAMSELMWCGSISHNGLTGLGRKNDFAPHKLGHEISGKFDAAHGASLSTIWAAWARYVYLENPARFARFADKVWDIRKESAEESALAGIAATVHYFKFLHMPTSFTELGIGVQADEVLGELADRCTDYGKHTVAVFKKLTREDVYQIYKIANH